jgi:hypothetical protein
VNGACRTGKVEYPVNFKKYGLCHIMGDEFEAGVGKEMGNVSFPSREIIIQAQNLVSIS